MIDNNAPDAVETANIPTLDPQVARPTARGHILRKYSPVMTIDVRYMKENPTPEIKDFFEL